MKTKDIFALASVCVAFMFLSGTSLATTLFERGLDQALGSLDLFMVGACAFAAVVLMLWLEDRAEPVPELRSFGTPEIVLAALLGLVVQTLFLVAPVMITVFMGTATATEHYPTATFTLALAILAVTAYQVTKPELAEEA